MRIRNPLAIGLAGLLSVAGCGQEDDGLEPRRFALQSFRTCDELESYLREVALDALEHQMGHGGIAVGGGFGRGAAEDALEGGGEPAPPMAGDGATGGGGGGLTRTNVQEAGVDEADFLKTDDEFLYVLHGNQLVIVRAVPAAGSEIVSETELAGQPSQLYVHGDLAVVFAAEAAEVAPPVLEAGDVWIGQPALPQTRITVWDVADRTAPRLVRTSVLDGWLIGSRMADGAVRVVSAHAAPIALDWNVDPGVPYPEPPSCWQDGDVGRPVSSDGGGAVGGGAGSTEPASPPDAPTMAGDEPGGEDGSRREGARDDADCEAAWAAWQEQVLAYQEAYVAALRAANEDRIRALTLDDFLPRVRTETDGGERDDRISECGSFYRTDVFAGYGLISVSTIDLDEPGAVLNATTVLGDHGTLYASGDQLYLAIAHYLQWDWAGPPPVGEPLVRTAIHQFDIGADRRAAPYVASGEVPGWLINQFAMDEHDGHLRIATTVDRFTEDFAQDRDNRFAVLRPEAELLVEIGRIEAIAPGEQIMAARMFDDRGYLVTFRQVDPLFSIDLRDPANPVITGEVEIPGFSQYVHPLGPDHLLTVGTAATPEGGWLGSQLAIFDVSDPTAPAQTHTHFLGEGQSEAQYDHKALTFKASAAAAGLLALPMTDWSEGQGAQLLLFDVSATGGFVERGAISHADLFASDETYYCGWRDVRRGVLSDEHVYSVSTAGYKVNALDGMDEVTRGRFPEADLCGYAVPDGGGRGGAVPPDAIDVADPPPATDGDGETSSSG